jgi:putative PIN family toxin of toxin-antitoxin system
MRLPQVVLDTNVWIAALRSRRGASFKVLSLVGQGLFQINLSVPLVFEYEETAKRLAGEVPLTAHDIDAVLDYLCRVGNRWQIYYLWRPFLPDPKDDMVLELAVAAGCEAIVTFNQSDFRGVEQFGVQVVRPQELLHRIGVK